VLITGNIDLRAGKLQGKDKASGSDPEALSFPDRLLIFFDTKFWLGIETTVQFSSVKKDFIW